MKTYNCVDLVLRKHKKWTVAQAGAQRELIALYGAVDGVQRKLFSAMTKWERYALLVSTTYDFELIGNANLTQSKDDNNRYIWTYSDCTLDQNTGKFTLSGSNLCANAYSGKSDNRNFGCHSVSV